MAQHPSRQFVAFDLETTGLIPDSDRVVEVGAVRFDEEGREFGRFERLVNPGRPMSPSAQAVHGLSDADLADAPAARDVLPAFIEFLGDPERTTLLAHNATFDAAFLGTELTRAGRPVPGHQVVDTLALSRALRPDLPNHRLDTLAAAFGLDTAGPHRALADSRRVMGLWVALGGPGLADAQLMAYPIRDDRSPFVVPVGWDGMVEAITTGRIVRMEYQGGRGGAPREVTPRGFVHRGGVAYLLAYCHLDAFEKSFRLDRVRRYEVVS